MVGIPCWVNRCCSVHLYVYGLEMIEYARGWEDDVILTAVVVSSTAELVYVACHVISTAGRRSFFHS